MSSDTSFHNLITGFSMGSGLPALVVPNQAVMTCVSTSATQQGIAFAVLLGSRADHDQSETVSSLSV